MRRGGSLFAAVAFLVMGFGASVASHAAAPDQAPLTISLNDGLKVVLQAPDILGNAPRVEIVAASSQELARVSIIESSKQSGTPAPPPGKPAAPPEKRVSPPRDFALPRTSPGRVTVPPPAPAPLVEDVRLPRVLVPFFDDPASERGILDTTRTMPVALAAVLIAAMASTLVLSFVRGTPLEAVRR